eukprot:3291869-Amphidinium_carterae.2
MASCSLFNRCARAQMPLVQPPSDPGPLVPQAQGVSWTTKCGTRIPMTHSSCVLTSPAASGFVSHGIPPRWILILP